MTTAFTEASDPVIAAQGVYAPQDDSLMLVEAMDKTGLAKDRRVIDLCTGSGVVAIGAAEQGAAAVTALDICPRAVRCARGNALAAGAEVEVHLGSWARAFEYQPFDLVVCNPPYVPYEPGSDDDEVPSHVGPERSFNAGYDGRLVLDPLCASVPEMLTDGGSMLLVHSEFSGVEQSLHALRAVGMTAEVLLQQWIPFGPVLTARAGWLERTGRLEPGRRDEKLVVIRADKS